jgi:cation diffusion facilitator family transporter
MQNTCSIDHQSDLGIFLLNEKKTKWVAFITLITMVMEIMVGHWSGSMALLADGWHMASHALALFLSVFVYYLYRLPAFRNRFTFGGGKILSLGGYTSSLFLIIIAISMIWESFLNFYSDRVIHYREAMTVAILGFVVNIICAYILHKDEGEKAHTHHENCSHHIEHDHNHQGAYIHILTDALTSLLAIIALGLGKWQGWNWADPLVGLLGGAVVFKWSLSLVRQSGFDLLDAHEETIDQQKLVQMLEADGSKVIDVHLWRLAPGKVGCELIIQGEAHKKSSDYKNLINRGFNIHHLIIEVV